MPEENETEKLAESQRVREASEEKLARLSTDEEEAAQHERRAEKSRYLRSKLEERAASEQGED